MRKMFYKITDFRIWKAANPNEEKKFKYSVPGFLLPFKVSVDSKLLLKSFVVLTFN